MIAYIWNACGNLFLLFFISTHLDVQKQIRGRRRCGKKINNLSPFSIQLLLRYFLRRNGKIYFSSLSKIITTLRYREEHTRERKKKHVRMKDILIVK